MDFSTSQHAPKWSARQVVTATLLIAAILVLFLLLYRFSNVIFILLISIVLSTGIRPAVTRMSHHRIPRSVGVILLYILGLSLAVIFVIFAFPLLIEQITKISSELPTYYDNFRLALFQSHSRILALIAIWLPSEVWMLTTNFSGGSGEPLSQVAQSLYYGRLITRGAFTLTAILFLGFYWTLESERSIRSLLLWVPLSRRDQVRDFLATIEDKVGSFIVGQGLLCLSIGAMALAAYQVIGLPYALVLAVIAAIMEAVPVVGPILGAIPALLVAFSYDPEKAVWVILASLLIQGLENYLLVPRVMKRSVGVNPLVVLLSIAAFTSLFGLAGAVLSIPIAAIIQLTIDRFIIKPVGADFPVSDGRGQVSLLRYEAHHLAEDMRKQIRQGEHLESPADDMVDTLESIARDLDQLLAETEQRMVNN